jgi:cytochrome c556
VSDPPQRDFRTSRGQLRRAVALRPGTRHDICKTPCAYIFQEISDLMQRNVRTVARAASWAAGCILAAMAVPAAAQAVASSPAATAAAAKQAVEYRKAAFTLLGGNFRPIGAILQGRTQYQPAEARRYVPRLVFLAELLDDAFPDISKTGDTRAKPEIWSNRADFDARLREFQNHTAALAQWVKGSDVSTDGFKNAALAVAQDCKSCHDHYRSE